MLVTSRTARARTESNEDRLPSTVFAVCCRMREADGLPPRLIMRVTSFGGCDR